jgi:hypothetical protein
MNRGRSSYPGCSFSIEEGLETGLFIYLKKVLPRVGEGVSYGAGLLLQRTRSRNF